MRHIALVSALLFTGAALGQPAAPDKATLAAYTEQVLGTAVAADGPGMAVLVARGDEVLWRGARGMANIELGVPLSADQVFRLGSVTKQIAAAGLLKLVDDGKIALDDPLTKYVPDYPNGSAITVRMLLDHTSGVRSYTDMPGVMDGPIMADLSTSALIDTFKDEPVDFAPGERWHYNNSGYVLLGAVIEAASGKPWHVWLDESLFQPLAMRHTGYGNQVERIIPGHVSGYTLKDGHWAQARYLSMTQPHAAGALSASVDDLLRWNRSLHEGKVLKTDTYRQMITPAGKAAESKYGFGIVADTLRGERMLQHGGGINGFSTYLLYLPDSGLTVAALYNADSGKPGALGAETVARMIAAQAIGKPYPSKQPIPVDEATLKSYEGVYRVDDNATRVLRVVDGKLTSQRTGGPVFTLIPVARDTFAFEEGFTRLLIERDNDGAISAMRLFPEDEGEGQLAPRTDDPMPAARTELELPRDAKERLVGEYRHQGMTMTIALDGDVLTTQLTGQAAHPIFAESPNRFFLKVVEATLEFAPEQGTPATLTLRQGPAVIEFTRQP